MEIYKQYYFADTAKDFAGDIEAFLRSLAVGGAIGLVNGVRGGFALTEFLVNLVVGTLIGVLFWLVLLFIANIVRAPAKLNKENLQQIALRDEEIKKLHEQKRDLEERAKPKLDIRLVEGTLTYRQTLPVSYDGGTTVRQQTVFRVSIHNVSSTETIDTINVALLKTEPNVLPYIPTPLHAMNDAPKILNAGDPLFIDILGVEEWTDASGKHQRLFWYFDHPLIRDLIETGLREYAITITASGRGSPSIARDFRFVVDRDGVYRLTT